MPGGEAIGAARGETLPATSRPRFAVNVACPRLWPVWVARHYRREVQAVNVGASLTSFVIHLADAWMLAPSKSGTGSDPTHRLLWLYGRPLRPLGVSAALPLHVLSAVADGAIASIPQDRSGGTPDIEFSILIVRLGAIGTGGPLVLRHPAKLGQHPRHRNPSAEVAIGKPAPAVVKITAPCRLSQLARVAAEVLVIATRTGVDKQLSVADLRHDQQSAKQAPIVYLSGLLCPWHEDARVVWQSE